MRGARPVTVYLRWPEQDLLSLAPLVRLLWGTLIDGLITVYDETQGRGCKPVLLLIDEAGRTAIPSLADHATTVVGRSVSLWVAIQSLSQLEAVYGRARARVLRDNMESQIFYRPADQETADYLERCLGRRSGYAHSQTLHDGAQTGEGLSEQGVPLMPAQEIKQMSDTAIIAFHRNLPPFQARRMDWRHVPELTKRRGLPAPKLPALPPVEERQPIRPWQGSGELVSSYIDPDRIS
jgi:type IV secretion system protein VirD4